MKRDSRSMRFFLRLTILIFAHVISPFTHAVPSATLPMSVHTPSPSQSDQMDLVVHLIVAPPLDGEDEDEATAEAATELEEVADAVDLIVNLRTPWSAEVDIEATACEAREPEKVTVTVAKAVSVTVATLVLGDRVKEALTLVDLDL